MPFTFNWIAPGRLVACSYPEPDRALSELRALGVQRLVNLTHRRHDPGTLATLGMDEVNLPVRDFTAPSQATLDAAVSAIRESHTAGRAVAIHCRGGLGRSGTVAAAWMTTQGLSAEEAIDHVRAIRPGSIETRRQERAVREFAARQMESGC